jgi:hypothetical protein
LLTGSPALGTGTTVASISSDQRGAAIFNPPDIGACQS